MGQLAIVLGRMIAASQGLTPLSIVMLLVCIGCLAVGVTAVAERVIIFICDADLWCEKRRN